MSPTFDRTTMPKTMEEALEWYANFDNWKRRPNGKNQYGNRKWHKPSAHSDGGAMARFFLLTKGKSGD